MTDVTIVLPAVSEDRISTDLRELTEVIAMSGADIASGLLGGEFGYGAHFENDVFEMHPYNWDDCTCGFETAEWDWEKSHPHRDDCYQAEIKRRGIDKIDGVLDRSEALQELALEYGLDAESGYAVHCTCGRDEQYRLWLESNNHDPKCGVALPNFLHKASGFSVDWYKYIGRGMELSREISRKEWRKIYDECLESVEGN